MEKLARTINVKHVMYLSPLSLLSRIICYSRCSNHINCNIITEKNFVTLHLEIQAHNWPKCQTSTTWNILKL